MLMATYLHHICGMRENLRAEDNPSHSGPLKENESVRILFQKEGCLPYLHHTCGSQHHPHL